MDAVVLTGGRRYEIAWDLSLRTLVFVRGSVTDDANGRPVPPPYRVSCDEPLLLAADHAAGYSLSGDADAVFVDRTIAHSVEVQIAAEGFRPALATTVVPANPAFPADAPMSLRRWPVRITGRITALASGAPVANARLTVAGPALPAPSKAVLLDRPLAADLTGGATLQGHSIVAVASPVPVKTVLAPVAAGRLELLVNDRRGLVAGQLLRFGTTEQCHWAEISAVSPTPANFALPGIVKVTVPLAASVAANAQAAPFDLGGATGPVCSPIGPAFAGEGLLILDDVPTGDVVAIADPPAKPRYAGLGVLSDGAGDYAIDGLARLAAPVLQVKAGGFAIQSRSTPLPAPPARGPTIIDWRLKP